MHVELQLLVVAQDLAAVLPGHLHIGGHREVRPLHAVGEVLVDHEQAHRLEDGLDAERTGHHRVAVEVAVEVPLVGPDLAEPVHIALAVVAAVLDDVDPVHQREVPTGQMQCGHRPGR